MPSGKYIALSNYVAIDGTDVSDYCRSFTPGSEFNLVDVSGFNAAGTDENLVGQRTTSATATFFDVPAVFDILRYFHENKVAMPISYRKDLNSAVGSTNPSFGGNVYVRTLTPGVTRGDVATYDVEFIAADATGLVWAYS